MLFASSLSSFCVHFKVKFFFKNIIYLFLMISFFIGTLKVLLLEDQMSERSYLAEMAGLSMECRMDDNAGFTLRVFGFADKAPRLLLEALSCLGNQHHGQTNSTSPQSSNALSSTSTAASSSLSSSSGHKSSLLSAQRFSALKEQLARRYRNSNLKPAKHASRLRLALLLPNTFSPAEKLAALMGTTADQDQDQKLNYGDKNENNYLLSPPLTSSGLLHHT